MLGADETFALTGPSGRRRLSIRAGDRTAGLSRRVAEGVRCGLSGGRVAQHVGRKCRPTGCSSWSASAGSTYAGCPRKRAGLSSAGATASIGHGAPAISDSTIRAMAGEVWSPKPPCPASQKKPSARAIEAGDRVAVRRKGPQSCPAAMDPADRHRRPLFDAVRGQRDLIFVGLGVARVARHFVHRRGEQPAELRREIELVADRLGERPAGRSTPSGASKVMIVRRERLEAERRHAGESRDHIGPGASGIDNDAARRS